MDLQSVSVGNRILDAQHRKLLQLCRVAESCLAGDRRGAVGRFRDALHDLALYANEHFRIEEQILMEAGFPFLEALKREHLAYRAMLAELFAEADRDLDSSRLKAALSDWWREHLRADREFVGFLSDEMQSAGQPPAAKHHPKPRAGRIHGHSSEVREETWVSALRRDLND